MHLAVSERSGDAEGLGGGPQHTTEIGVAVSYCAAVGSGSWDDVDHARGRREQADGLAVAGALPCGRDRWVAARCNATRPQASPEKVQDVVGLYLNPPDGALVLSVDEKSQVQALDRTQPGLPMKKGRAGTMTHDYKRHGTTSLFAALDVATGAVIGQCMKRHRHHEFLRFLRTIHRQTPKKLDLLAQSGRALLRPDHSGAHPSRRLHFGSRARSGHSRLPGTPQCRPQAFRLDQISPRNPGKSHSCPKRAPADYFRESNVRSITLASETGTFGLDDVSLTDPFDHDGQSPGT